MSKFWNWVNTRGTPMEESFYWGMSAGMVLAFLLSIFVPKISYILLVLIFG